MTLCRLKEDDELNSITLIHCVQSFFVSTHEQNDYTNPNVQPWVQFSSKENKSSPREDCAHDNCLNLANRASVDSRGG